MDFGGLCYKKWWFSLFFDRKLLYLLPKENINLQKLLQNYDKTATPDADGIDSAVAGICTGRR